MKNASHRKFSYNPTLKKSLFNSLQAKIVNKPNTLRDKFIEKLESLFSKPSSNFINYIEELEYILLDFNLTKEQLFKFTLEGLVKLLRSSGEVTIIATYLFFMKGLTNLFSKTIEQENNQKILYEKLRIVAELLEYERYPKNRVLLKYGDIGTKAYINLYGSLAVLVKSPILITLTRKEYLYYLANLICYKEFELLNVTINENFLKFPIEILDDININKTLMKHQKEISSNKLIEIHTPNDIPFESEKSFKSRSQQKTLTIKTNDSHLQLSNNKEDNSPNETINQETINNNFIKYNEINELCRETTKYKKIKISELLKSTKLKIHPKKIINECTVDEYIKRLNVIKSKELPKSQNNISTKNFINNSENDINQYNSLIFKPQKEIKTYQLKIFTYMQVAKIDIGSVFGEMALNNENLMRTATVITLEDCHFGILKKKAYEQSLKYETEKKHKDIIYYLLSLPNFRGMQFEAFYKKYYNFLTHTIIKKGEKIITQNNIPKFVAFLKKGSYILTCNMSLNELTNLIYFFCCSKKSKIPKEKCQIILGLVHSYNNFDSSFKKFYDTKNFINICEINSPDIVGYVEYIGPNGKYAFNVETKSNSAEYFSFKNNYYEDMQNKNEIVRVNQDELSANKLDLMIERLLNVRKNIINSYKKNKQPNELSYLFEESNNYLKMNSPINKEYNINNLTTQLKLYNSSKHNRSISHIYKSEKRKKNYTNFKNENNKIYENSPPISPKLSMKLGTIKKKIGKKEDISVLNLFTNLSILMNKKRKYIKIKNKLIQFNNNGEIKEQEPLQISFRNIENNKKIMNKMQNNKNNKNNNIDTNKDINKYDKKLILSPENKSNSYFLKSTATSMNKKKLNNTDSKDNSNKKKHKYKKKKLDPENIFINKLIWEDIKNKISFDLSNEKPISNNNSSIKNKMYKDKLIKSSYFKERQKIISKINSASFNEEAEKTPPPITVQNFNTLSSSIKNSKEKCIKEKMLKTSKFCFSNDKVIKNYKNDFHKIKKTENETSFSHKNVADNKIPIILNFFDGIKNKKYY